MTTRREIIERMAMALPGWGLRKPTATGMRRRWAKATHSLQGVYRQAAEEIIQDTRKLGLRIELAPKKTKRRVK